MGLNQKIAANGAASLAAGALFGIGSLCCPCPLCWGTAGIFIAGGLKEKFAP